MASPTDTTAAATATTTAATPTDSVDVPMTGAPTITPRADGYFDVTRAPLPGAAPPATIKCYRVTAVGEPARWLTATRRWQALMSRSLVITYTVSSTMPMQVDLYVDAAATNLFWLLDTLSAMDDHRCGESFAVQPCAGALAPLCSNCDSSATQDSWWAKLMRFLRGEHDDASAAPAPSNDPYYNDTPSKDASKSRTFWIWVGVGGGLALLLLILSIVAIVLALKNGGRSTPPDAATIATAAPELALPAPRVNARANARVNAAPSAIVPSNATPPPTFGPMSTTPSISLPPRAPPILSAPSAAVVGAPQSGGGGGRRRVARTSARRGRGRR